MHFVGIDIQNFRGIEQLKLDNFGKINLIVGKNNTYKTTILEALFTITGISNPELLLRINQLRDLFYTDEKDFALTFTGLNFTNRPLLKGELDDSFRTLSIEPGRRSSNQLVQKRDNSKLIENSISFDSNENKENLNEIIYNFTTENKNTKKKTNHKCRIYFEKGIFLTEQPQNYSEKMTGHFLSHNIQLSQEAIRRLERMIIAKKTKEIIEILKIIDPAIVGIHLGLNGMIYCDIGINNLIPLNLMGDGIRRTLAILLGITNTNNGVVFIDEIDNGLHHTSLSALWKAIINISNKNNIQIFATTHSIEAINSLKSEVENENEQNTKDSTALFSLKRVGAKMRAYRYSFDEISAHVEQKIEMR